MTTLLILVALVGAAPQMPLSVATTDDALAVYANPAGLGVGRGAELYWLYNFERRPFWDNNALVASAGPLGAFWEPGTRYGLALGAGGEGFLSGMRLVRDSVTRWDTGAMWRPARWLSLGATWLDMNHDWGMLGAGVGLRPLGSRLTLVADIGTTRLAHDPGFTNPVFGIEAEPLDGLALCARFRPSDRSVVAGLVLGFGQLGIGGAGSRVGERYQAGGLLRVGREHRRSLIPLPGRFVELELDGSVADVEPGFSLLGARPSRTTWELLELLDRCRTDRSVRGVVLRLEGAGIGYAQAQELRQALVALRDAGKRVYVYAPEMGMTSYYIASAADKVIGHPTGLVVIPGFSLEALFLKGTLERLGLEFSGQRFGEYKSATETFTEDSLSPANRTQLEALLDAAYGQFTDAVAAGRELPVDSVRALVDRGLFSMSQARAAGLVDTVCYHDELDDLLEAEAAGFRKLTEERYDDRAEFDCSWQGPPLVAVIHAAGEIAAGESRTDFLTGGMTVGAATLVRAIRSAREDRRVKAIVLRVDSPGGDGFASDLIWRELELVEKPLVVSMGNLAASGGYYISCNADRVFASPGTVTGSIGGFSFKFVTEGLYNKLGARRQVLKRGEHADLGSDTRAYTPEEDSILEAMVGEFCRDFIAKVARGRGLAVEAVDSVAGGRVWSGADAQRLGLVDSLGGLLAAIGWAREQAGLKECDYVFYPEPASGIMGFVRRLLGSEARKVLGR